MRKEPEIIQVRRGFTLIEILVVVALIVALIGILIPSLAKVKSRAYEASARAELGAIQTGLQQYFNLFKMYPPSAPVYGGIGVGRGAAMLTQGLMGYLPYDVDGAGPTLSGGGASPSPTDPKYSFRTRKAAAAMGGEAYGPYMQSDPKVLKYVLATDQVFIDPWGHEILYFRSQRPVPDNTRPAITLIFAPASTSDNYLFAADDCKTTNEGTALNAAVPANPVKFFSLFTPGTSNAYAGGTVVGADSYLLISAGPDGIYFNGDDIVAGK